ncbi:hypothetical protein KP509_16G075700 [Ceratopteris richardii]|uniref:Uncharacterized protein n=1 Tax=Ceratopteris richardii TaxID=49495 RepID=A0A8T2T1N8_CERRI|nr:hypothetical protein KP509_16G075700 [Ceratopteris richardii]
MHNKMQIKSQNSVSCGFLVRKHATQRVFKVTSYVLQFIIGLRSFQIPFLPSLQDLTMIRILFHTYLSIVNHVCKLLKRINLMNCHVCNHIEFDSDGLINRKLMNCVF